MSKRTTYVTTNSVDINVVYTIHTGLFRTYGLVVYFAGVNVLFPRDLCHAFGMGGSKIEIFITGRAKRWHVDEIEDEVVDEEWSEKEVLEKQKFDINIRLEN